MLTTYLKALSKASPFAGTVVILVDGKGEGETMTVFEKHQIAIAKATLRMSDAGARAMGGMTKAEAEVILKVMDATPIPMRRKAAKNYGRLQ